MNNQVPSIGVMVFLFKRLALMAVLAVEGCSACAHASAFTFGTVSIETISPSADTLSFNGSTGIVNAGSTFLQTGAWTINDSGSLNQYIPFTFSDILTIDNVTRVLTFSGGLNVSPSADTLTIASLSPVIFGNMAVSFTGFSISDGNLESVPVTLTGTATAVTGEPSSLLLMGTGLLAATIWMMLRARNAVLRSRPM